MYSSIKRPHLSNKDLYQSPERYGSLLPSVLLISTSFFFFNVKIILFYFFKFYFIFKLYIIVLVLPNITKGNLCHDFWYHKLFLLLFRNRITWSALPFAWFVLLNITCDYILWDHISGWQTIAHRPNAARLLSVFIGLWAKNGFHILKYMGEKSKERYFVIWEKHWNLNVSVYQ